MNLFRFTLLCSFAASGFAGLIYESIWSRYLKLFLGHAAYSQTLVIALFMGGLSLGSWLASRHTVHWRYLLRWYAITEAVIGLFGLLFHPLYELITGLAYDSLLPGLGSPLAVGILKLVLSSLLVLPASVLLGLTFPLMSAGVVRLFPHLAGSSVSMLYFTNSMGAAVGVMVSGFFLVGHLGLPGTTVAAAVINLAVAAIVYVAVRVVGEEESPQEIDAPDTGQNADASPIEEGAPPYGLMLLVAGLTGLASFVYEIGWIRMLSLVLGSSTHSFELMLSAFIAGLACGAWWIKRRIDGIASPVRYLGMVQMAMGLLALVTILIYANSFELMRAIMRGLSRTEEGYAFFNLASHAVALIVMFPATFCAGMTLPLITFALLKGRCGERSIGAVYAANTVGAIAGVVAATHIGMPLLGLKGLVTFGAAIDLGLGVILLRLAAGGRRRLLPGFAAALAIAAVAATLGGLTLDPLKMASGVYRYGHIISHDTAENTFHEDGKTSSVDLVRYPSGRLVIFTNGKGEASINVGTDRKPATDEVTMVLSGALPLAAYPQARSAAVIGMGSGQTSHVMLGSSSLERLDTIEIEAAVTTAARQFGAHVERVFDDPRSHVFIDDARTFMSTHNARYDIIVAEPSNPWVTGVSSLFTREFYELTARHLTEGGILAQWLQLYEIEPRLVASIMRALAQTFPDYAIYATDNANMIILARKGGAVGPLGGELFRHPAIAAELRRHHIYTAGDLDARRIGDGAQLQPLFDSYEVPANTDYEPFLDLHAARSRFLDHSADGLLALRTAPIPVLDFLGSGRPSPIDLSVRGAEPAADGYGLLALVQGARGVRDYYDNPASGLRRVSAGMRRDVGLSRSRLEQPCAGPAEAQQWLQSLFTVAAVVNTGLPSSASNAIWKQVESSPCHANPQVRGWVALFSAVGARDATAMAAAAERILSHAGGVPPHWRGYALAAAMAGHIARGKDGRASELWNRLGPDLVSGSETQGREELLFRLLRAHSAL